jgi:23S rRNA pseudouridine1911/1915/1917 synthase
VRVDGEKRGKSHRLSGGEELELDVAPLEEQPLAGEEMDLAIAYEDEQLLIVDKPAGVVVHPTSARREGTLVHGLLDRGAAGGDADRPGIVHRLDRDTSGLLVVTRGEEAHRRMQELVRSRELEREYLALVRGHPESRSGRIEAPIGRDRADATRHSLDTATPRDAVTHFELAEVFPAYALLRVRLETGRTHQIRVHLQAIGLPVSGDPVYGGAGDLGLKRQFLHAARLAFTHPFTAERVDVTSGLPPDLASALETARLG